MYFELGGFAIVLLMIWFGYHFIKKANFGVFGIKNKKRSSISIVDQGIFAGMNQRLQIVRVGNEYYVHSFGPQGVALEQTTYTESAPIAKDSNFTHLLKENIEESDQAANKVVEN